MDEMVKAPDGAPFPFLWCRSGPKDGMAARTYSTTYIPPMKTLPSTERRANLPAVMDRVNAGGSRGNALIIIQCRYHY